MGKVEISCSEDESQDREAMLPWEEERGSTDMSRPFFLLQVAAAYIFQLLFFFKKKKNKLSRVGGVVNTAVLAEMR